MTRILTLGRVMCFLGSAKMAEKIGFSCEIIKI
jgi:hypothetical protein